MDVTYDLFVQLGNEGKRDGGSGGGSGRVS